MTSKGERKKKILRVIARLNVGGPAIHTILLTDSLNNDQYESLLVSGNIAKEEGNMSYLAEEKGVNIYNFPYLQRELSLKDDLRALYQMVKLLWNYQPDIVHTHTAKAGFVGRSAVRIHNLIKPWKKIRTVHTFHGHVFHGYFSPLKTKLFIWIERFLARSTDTIITITPKQQEEILSFGVGTEKNHKLVPLGLELDKFYFHERKQSLYELFDIDKNKKLIGTVARFTAIKNLTLFLEIAKSLLEQHNDLHFMMVGDGEERKMLETEARKLGIQDHVTFTGFLKNLPDVYADLSVMVLTSFNEGSPVSIIEALSSGTPVVASNVGGVPDLLTGEAKKYLCDPKDKNTFIHAINLLLNNTDTVQNFVENHKERTYQLYSYKRLIKDLTSIYEEIS